MNTNKLISEFKENGFIVLNGFFSFETIEKLINLKKEIESNYKNNIVKHPSFDLYSGLFELEPELFLNIIMQKELFYLLEQLMGPFIQIDGLTIVSHYPFLDRINQLSNLHWHRDPWSYVPNEGCYRTPICLNILTYFQDLHSENGPLRVIPGSHKSSITLKPSERKLPHPEEITLELKKGDAIIFHHCLIHSRTPNITDTSRCYLSILLNHSWLKQSIKFEGENAKYIISKAFDESDFKTLRLFGIDLQLSERANSGFLDKDLEMWQEWSQDDYNAFRGA